MRRRAWLVVLGAVGSTLLTACAGIPSSGPVHEAGQLSGGGEDPFTRIVAAPPLEGADPQTIVGGFLNASASFDNDHEVAKEFLTPATARSWNPNAGAQIYVADTVQGGGSSPTAAGADTILFTPPLAGTLSAQGSYTPATQGQRLNVEFRLAKVGGQWRIASLPDGLLLTTGDKTRAYRPFDIYFPNPARTVVVPDQIWVPVGPGQATSLVRALLQGPTPWLGKAVRTAIPPGTRLVVDSVPVRDGVVQVDLSAAAANVSRTEAEAMSAQFTWTLRQLSQVTTLRLTVEGVPLRAPGLTDTQSILAWSSFDPDAGAADSQAFAVNEKGRAVVLRTTGSTTGLQPVRGPLGDGSVALSMVVPSFDGSELAGLDTDRRRLVLAQTTANAKAEVAVLGTSLTPPSWDRLGEVWVGDRDGRTNKILVVTPGSAVYTVPAALPPGTLRAIRVARDGIRVAVLMEDSRGVGQVYVGLVVRSGSKESLAEFRPVTSGFADTDDVAWASADRLALLAREHATDPVQAWLVTLDGSEDTSYQAVNGGVAMVSIAAAPTRPVLASTSDGNLWNYTPYGWSALGKGAFPAYPG